MRLFVRFDEMSKSDLRKIKGSVPLLLDTALQASEILVLPQCTNNKFDIWWVIFKFSQSLKEQLKQKDKQTREHWGSTFEYIWTVVPVEHGRHKTFEKE